MFCNGVYVRTLCSEEQTQISDPPAPGHWAQLDMSPCTQCLLGKILWNVTKSMHSMSFGGKFFEMSQNLWERTQRGKKCDSIEKFSGFPKLILFSFLCVFFLVLFKFSIKVLVMATASIAKPLKWRVPHWLIRKKEESRWSLKQVFEGLLGW